MTIDKVKEFLKEQQWTTFEKLNQFVKSEKRMFLIDGVAGSGKTTLISCFIKYYLESAPNPRLACTATTNKAVKVLTQKVNIDDDRLVFSTIHKRLSLKETVTDWGERLFIPDFENKDKDFQFDFIIVDECSMISNYKNERHEKSKSVWENIQELSNRFNIKFIFVGDFMQIPPVNEPFCILSDSKTIIEHNIEVVKLDQVLRQASGSPIIKLATYVREHINYRVLQHDVITEVTDLGCVTHLPRENTNFVLKSIYDLVSDPAYKRDGDFVRLMGYTNKTVTRMNKVIRDMVFPNSKSILEIGDKLIADNPIIRREDEYNSTVLFTTSDEFVVEEVMEGLISTPLLKNEDPFKCFWVVVRMEVVNNEDVVHKIPIIHPESSVRYNSILQGIKNRAIAGYDKKLWRFYYRLSELFAPINYAYALTVHKSQGSTFKHGIVLEKDIMINMKIPERNQILYTAYTRPSHHLHIVR